MSSRHPSRVALLLVVGLLMIIGANEGTAQSSSTFDHSAFDQVLATHVDDTGMVDYAALKAHRSEHLDPYLEQLAETDVDALSPDETLALWINAYNALTLAFMLDHYPVDSIWETTPGETAATTEENPFEQPVGTVAGRSYTLDEIEHNEIDAHFDDPRFHFAIVCAAVSCPPLRVEAYTGDQLDTQLHDQAVRFIHDHPDNRISSSDDTIHVSTVFEWFIHDFGGDTDGIQAYLAPFFEGTVRKQLEEAAFHVEFTDYDWTINRQ